jgi:hypothetical protein
MLPAFQTLPILSQKNPQSGSRACGPSLPEVNFDSALKSGSERRWRNFSISFSTPETVSTVRPDWDQPSSRRRIPIGNCSNERLRNHQTTAKGHPLFQTAAQKNENPLSVREITLSGDRQDFLSVSIDRDSCLFARRFPCSSSISG